MRGSWLLSPDAHRTCLYELLRDELSDCHSIQLSVCQCQRETKKKGLIYFS